MTDNTVFLSGERVALVACSDPLLDNAYVRNIVSELEECLKAYGLIPERSPYLFRSVTGSERAAILMGYYKDRSIRGIFDLSGGNVAHEIIEYLDFDAIRDNPKTLFGYSDLTCLINTIYSRCNVNSVLFQVRNLVSPDGSMQRHRFRYMLEGGDSSLMTPKWEFWNGKTMEGIVLGGNIRCFLKLEGTPWFPTLQDRILLLEARSGSEETIRGYFERLHKLNVFSQVSGVLLGTFTEFESQHDPEYVKSRFLEWIGTDSLPVAKTDEIGHGTDSKAMVIGAYTKVI